MNWAQFKDSVCHMCPVGAVVMSWSLTQDVAGSSSLNENYFFVPGFAEFSENI